MPHIEQKYNILEVINEIVTTTIIYTLKGFLSTTFLDSSTQWRLGYVTIVLISIVFFLNFSMMIKMLIRELKKLGRWWRSAKGAKEEHKRRWKKAIKIDYSHRDK